MTYDYARLKNIKCFLFDMDGTINLGNAVSYTHLTLPTTPYV